MKQRYVCIFIAIIYIALFLPLRFSANGSARYQSYKEIPGVMSEDIDKIDDIIKEFGSLNYGTIITTESFLTEDGNIGGFSKLLCDRLTELLGIEFVPQEYDWESLVENLDSHKVDFTGELTPIPERLNKYFMTDAIVQRMIKIYTNGKTEKLSLIAKERAIRCAFLEGSNTYILVKDKWNYPFETVFLPDDDSIARHLERGEIDAYIEESVEEACFDNYDFIKVDIFYPLTYSPVSIATKNPKLEPVINIIQKYLKNGGAYELTQLYNQGMKDYYKNKLKFRLTDEEKEYLEKHKTPENAIILAVETDNYPACFFNVQENEFQGIAIDILNEIASISGLSIKIGTNKSTTWPETLSGLEHGKYSIVTELIYSENRKERFLWSDEPYCTNFYAMISRADFPYVDINQSLYMTIGLISGTAYSDVFYEWYPSSVKTKSYSTTEDAFKALENREIDLLMASQNLLLHLTNYMEKPGFKANIVFDSPSDTFFGFNKNEKTLCSIIGKAQQYIDLYNISERWKRKVFDYENKMMKDTMPYLIAFSIIITIGLFSVLSLFMKNRSLNKNLQKSVTERTKELENTVRKLESANRAKNEFLAKISHEIRTPMNAIVGMSELVLRENIPLAAHEDVIAIKQASANLLSIINDILDLSKIESGKLEIISDRYSVLSIINDVINIIRIRLMDKPILFVSNVDSNLPNNLIGDEIRIRQVMLNLLSNAAKYTKEGFISLAINCETIDEHSVMMKIEVSDSGIGIKKNDIPNLFGEFFQADAIRNKGIEGIGLGLSITKNLCKAMGGDITVESEYEKGSVFKVSLPQEVYSFEKFAVVENPETKNILIYETRKIYAESIVRSIKNLGMNCRLVTNQSNFFEELSNNTYNFIFLPVIIYEVTKSIIEKLSINSKIILLAEHNKLESSDAKTFHMPLHSLSIANIINGITDDSSYSDNNKDKYVRFTAPAAKILIVDDINTNLKVAEGLMAPYKMQIDLCESGKKAIELVKSNSYDIVFMDHMMPEMNGIEATHAIREFDSPKCKNVPIIALTANAVSGMKEMFLSNGFNDFISKPIEMKILNEILEKWISKDKKEKYIVMPKEKSTEEQLYEIEGINVKYGVLMAGESINNYFKILTVFYSDGKNMIAEIKECFRNDLKLYTTHVHALKSALTSIGASSLAEYARSLEQAGKEENLAYIKNNNDTFLEKLVILLGNIKSAILKHSSASKHNTTDKSLLPEKLKESLLKLKGSLNDMNSISVDNVLNDLSKMHFDSGIKETLEQIANHILLCDYDEAIEMIDLLLSATNQHE